MGTLKGKYQKNAAAGQLPLLKPDSEWICPTDLPDLRGRPMLAADLETRDDGLSENRGPGWVYAMGYICGAAIAADGISVYAPVRHPEGDCLDEDAVRRWYGDHIRSRTRVVFQNAPYDVGWAKAIWDIDAPDNLDDTMGMANILDENRYTYDLDAICRWQGLPGKDQALLEQAASTYGVDAKRGLWRLPARYVGPYAMRDAAATLEAARAMEPKIRAEGTWEAYRLEMDLVPMIVEMRRRGIRIDSVAAERLKQQLLAKRDQVLRELTYKVKIGRSVTIKDVRSEAWLTPLFGINDIKAPRLPSGQPSYESEWMEKSDHWLPRLVADARRYDMAGEKFIGQYIQNSIHRGRIHAEIHQYRDEKGGTRTSRLAYSGPPLQQMPSRDPEIAPLIRGLFLPEQGQIWGSLDYSQQEYRLLVHFAYLCKIVGAEKAIKIYRDKPDTDFHQLVVDWTGLIRTSAKDANFAKAYRAGVGKFALMIGKTEEEAAAIYAQYDEELPFVSRFAEFADSRAQARGYLIMLDGMRAHFDRYEARWIDKEKWSEGKTLGKPMEPCSLEEARRRVADKTHPWYGSRIRRADTYKAGNKLIQGSAARQTKLAMRECWRAGVVPMIQMHDELGFSFSDEQSAQIARDCMINAVKLEIPVVVDAEFGPDWGRAAKNKKTGYGATWDEAVHVLG